MTKELKQSGRVKSYNIIMKNTGKMEEKRERGRQRYRLGTALKCIGFSLSGHIVESKGQSKPKDHYKQPPFLSLQTHHMMMINVRAVLITP